MSKSQKSIPKTEQKYLVNITAYWRKDSVSKKTGKAPIQLYLYLKNEKVPFKTGVKIEKEFWDPAEQKIKKNHPEHKDYNLIILGCKSRINDIFVRYRLQHEELTPRLLRKEYDSPSSYIDFYSFCERILKENKEDLEEPTVRHHKSILGKLKKFAPKLNFSEIDQDFIKKYRIHLQKKYENEPWTIYANLAKIKYYLGVAKKHGIIKKSPFDEMKLIKPFNEREYLTENELQKLIDLYERQFLFPGHQKALRYFLFSCVTGLRISDVRSLMMEWIVYDMIIFTPKKTAKKKPREIKIPLTTYAKKLIQDETRGLRIHGRIFYDMLSDYRINRMLKEIMKVDKVKIEKDITFHVARHTFATIFLRRTKNLMVLRDLLGHTDIKETMVYAHVLGEDLISEMKTFDELIKIPAPVRYRQIR
jgi:integrase/recombinase XerD